MSIDCEKTAASASRATTTPWLEDGADREDAQPPVLEIRDGLLVACSERHRGIDRVAAVLLQCAHETARPGQDDEQQRERPLPSSSSSATTPLSSSPVASSAVAAFKAYWSRSGPVPLPMALLWLRFCFFRGEYDYVKSALGDLGSGLHRVATQSGTMIFRKGKRLDDDDDDDDVDDAYEEVKGARGVVGGAPAPGDADAGTGVRPRRGAR